MSETLRLQVAVDTDELRKWADRHADAGNQGVAAVLYAAIEQVDLQSLDLKDVTAGAERVRALHTPWEEAISDRETDVRRCRECGQIAPCQTVRALDDAHVYRTRSDLTAMVTAVQGLVANVRRTHDESLSGMELADLIEKALQSRATGDSTDIMSTAAALDRATIIAWAHYAREFGDFGPLPQKLLNHVERLHAAITETTPPDAG